MPVFKFERGSERTLFFCFQVRNQKQNLRYERADGTGIILLLLANGFISFV